MKEHKPTVFILNGDVEVVRSLRATMESVQLPVEGYSSVESLLESFDVSRPGCLILDVRMHMMSGLELARRLRMAGAAMPIIFVTSHGDVPTAVRAMQEGAFDFLQRPFSEQYLLDRVHAALDEDLHDRRRVLEQRAVAARFVGLSPKERQVVDLIVNGGTSKTMAHELGVGLKTVSFHRANIMKKVGVETVGELVCLFFKGGWTGATSARAVEDEWTKAGDDPAGMWGVPDRVLTERRTRPHLVECGRRA